MSKALSYAELDAEQIELLPDRTVMCGAVGGSATGVGVGGNGGAGGIGLNLLNINVLGSQTNSAGNGGAGGAGIGNL
jgi:hypothetical protein